MPCLTGNSSHPRRLRRLAMIRPPATRKKRPHTGGFLVYPLGFEPRLDGVGGRNVIQLHYEYVFLAIFYILLFFASILQAFMV